MEREREREREREGEREREREYTALIGIYSEKENLLRVLLSKIF